MRILLAPHRPKVRAAVMLIVAMLLASCSGQRSAPIPPTSSSASGGHARVAQSTTSTYANTVLATSGLVAYYRLGDTGTTTALDSSSHGFNGTYNGLGTALTQGTPGLITGDPEKSTTSNGSSAGYVATPRNAAFESPTTISIEAWVKLSSTSSYQSLVEYGDHTGLPFKGYGLKFNPSSVAFLLKIAVPSGSEIETKVTASVKAVVGQIYHVVGTYDGTAEKIYVNGQIAGSVALTGSIQYDGTDGGFIFNNQGHNAPTSGALQEVAFYNTALTATQVASHYAAGTTSQPPPSVVYSDWNTFGDGLARLGFNGNEKGLSTNNVGSLKVAWSADLGGAVTDQPVIASGLSVNGTSSNILYVGAENGKFYAINADTGTPLTGWPKQLGSVSTSCGDLPGGQFGITGTATFDRSNNVVYVADGNDVVHALNMVSGNENWSVNVLTDPNTNTIVGSATQDHIYGALAYNPVNGLLYVETASFCDHVPWHGRIVAIDTSTHQVKAAFFPGRTSSGKSGTAYCGGGIWGMGGASIDTTTQNVFVATGNIVTGTSTSCTGSSSQTFPYGDSIVELDQNLNLISSSPATAGNHSLPGDSDYGATPMLYNISGCSEQLSAKNKDGTLYTYSVGSSGLIYENGVSMGQPTGQGEFIGVPAFDPVSGVNLVYSGNPRAVSPYANGLVALQQKGSCTGLTLAWQASVSSTAVTSNDNQAPTVANGVVFFTDGVGDHLWAFAATQSGSSGSALFNSGTTIGPSCSYGTTCGVFGAATVDGRVFVGSFNHKLYAFSF
jgi:hypothetical protein